MIRASIDLGTNTCLLLIADWDPEQKKLSRVISDHSSLVRLGEGVDQKRQLQPTPMERVLGCLRNYAEKVRAVGVQPGDTVCVATSQARDAKNSEEFFSRIKQETGFSFRRISGKEEARYTFLGALLPEMSPENSWVIDIGGGSTEIISAQKEESIDIGSVRFTERFLKSDPVTDEEFWACQEAIDQGIQTFLPWRNQVSKTPQLVAVAGTATTLAAWHLGLTAFDSEKVNQVFLSRGDIHRMVEELKWRTHEERRQLPAMEPLRADVVLAGALILWRVLEILGFQGCRVSTRGLRYGLF